MYHFHCKYTFGTLEIAKLLSIDIYGLFYEINIGKPKYWSTPIKKAVNEINVLFLNGFYIYIYT